MGTVTCSHQRLHGPGVTTWVLLLHSVGLDGTHSGRSRLTANTYVPLCLSPSCLSSTQSLPETLDRQLHGSAPPPPSRGPSSPGSASQACREPRVRAPPLRGLAMSIGCTQRPQCTSEPTRPPVFLCLLSRSVPVNFRALHGPDPSRKCLFCAAPAWAGAPPILCSRLTLQVSARRQQACLKFCHRTTLSPWPQMRITCPLIHPVVPLCDPHGPQPARLRCPWYSPDKDTGVGCHFLLQGVFQTQGLNLCLLHGQVGHPAQISVCQEHLTGNLARRRGLTGLLDPIFIFTIDSVISYFFLISLCLHIF